MLRLRFYSPGEGAAESIEPGEFFRFIGSMLCRGAANDAVATWMARWLLRDAEFTRAESLDPVVIYFENNAGLASCAYGPFETLHVSDGAVWDGTRQLARLDPKTLLWHPPRAPDGWASIWSPRRDAPASIWWAIAGGAARQAARQRACPGGGDNASNLNSAPRREPRDPGLHFVNRTHSVTQTVPNCVLILRVRVTGRGGAGRLLYRPNLHAARVSKSKRTDDLPGL